MNTQSQGAVVVGVAESVFKGWALRWAAEQAQLERARQRQREPARAGLQHFVILAGVHPQRRALDGGHGLTAGCGKTHVV